MSRRTERIDYKILHNTGAKVLKSNCIDSSSTSDSDEFNSDSFEDTTQTSFINDDLSAEVLALSSLFETTSLHDNVNQDISQESTNQDIRQESTSEPTLNQESTSLDNTLQESSSQDIPAEIIQQTSDNQVILLEVNMTTKEEVGDLVKDVSIAQQTIADDIDDYIEENLLDEADVSELNEMISKAENLRSCYRQKHNELKQSAGVFYREMFEEDYQYRLLSIKKFILSAKDIKKNLKEKETKVQDDKVKEDKDSRKRSCQFLIKEINKLNQILNVEFTKPRENITDDEILKRNNDFPDSLKQMETLSKFIKQLLTFGFIGEREIDDQIEAIPTNHDILRTNKDEYITFVKAQVEARELSKQELFKEGKLKIHLPKFSGHDSKMDYYTFKSDFLKLHTRTTPKQFLPDLLKNNFLDGSALSLVRSLDDIDEIWTRLKAAYGDPKLLLKKKLGEFDNMASPWKSRNPADKMVSSLSKLINIMKDLVKLASEHDIESKLYYGDGIDRIYVLFGEGKLTKWLFHISEKGLTDKQLWTELIMYLEKDLKVQQQKLLIQNKSDDNKKDKDDEEKKRKQTKQGGSGFYGQGGQNQDNICSFCEGRDHIATNGPKGSKLIQYFACNKFVELTPNDRFLQLKKKGYCIQCLFPGAQQDKGRHQEGKCQRDFACKHSSHDRYPVRKHVLVCHEHRNTSDNQQLLEVYKQRCINKQTELPPFAKEIKLSLHVSSYRSSNDPTEFPKEEDSTNERAIFMLQTINVDGQDYSIFYDTGCNEMVCRHNAVQRIGSRAKQVVPGPFIINGVGNSQTISQHGVYQVDLPLFNGLNAKFSGMCLDEITFKLPTYHIQGAVENDIKRSYTKGTQKLPDLPPSVGGAETDFMIGIEYNRYHPKEIHMLPSGLAIYRSFFKNPDGSRGIVGGPHKIFTQIEANYPIKSFLTTQYKMFRDGYQLNPDIFFLHSSCNTYNVLDKEGANLNSNNDSYIARKLKLFQAAEDAGSEILYRCDQCRSCKTCKDHEQIENISLKEEVEQDLIDRSVTVNVEENVTEAYLPFLQNPSIKLTSNKDIALRVYNQVVKKLDKSTPQDKLDVIKSEAAIQQLGFVEFVSNLSYEDRKMLDRSPIKYYIPWRVVWKESSVTTPCRPVFDASLPTATGLSLNDVLPKGKNNMNKLVEIFIRWFTYLIAFHTDIKKMYNSIRLRREDWTFQRYIFQAELDLKKIPVEKIIKTCIYGVRPSGNQAERGLRETARISQDEYPDVYRIVNNDTYVDDCLSGGHDNKYACKLADELQIVLKSGGFILKGFTFSGSPPPENLSSDGISIHVAGMKWYPHEDMLSFNVSKLNFAKKRRGKKPTDGEDVIPDNITKRDCVSRVGEFFDITGKATPITATWKLDLHELTVHQLDWDDKIPDDLRPIWCSHFEMMKEINDLRFKRAVIPDDAVNINLETLDFSDASNKMCCVAIYARFLRKTGEYSCQLLFGRSKIVPTSMSQPRAELFAATVNTHTGQVVKRSLGEFHQNSVKVTDSQVVLYWINNDKKPLKQWVRNRVIEIRRFTETSDWKFTQSSNMIADIGTRRVKSLATIDQNSVWINGYPWMTKEKDCLPFKSFEEIRFSSDDLNELKKESLSYDKWIDDTFQVDASSEEVNLNSCNVATDLRSKDAMNVPEEVKICYKFSSYLLDPNKHRYHHIIRIMAIALRFVCNLKCSLKKKRTLSYDKEDLKCLSLTDQEILNARNYYFRKATKEVKEFMKPADYEKISVEKNETLFYTGRILSTEKISCDNRLSKAMQDLCATTFCVPLVYKHSPLAYSIVNEIHWHSNVAKHSGPETVWRYVLQLAFIFSGRALIKKFKLNCIRCRYLRKKFIDIEMGPVSKHNLNIAPPFYVSQTDIFGPLKAFDPCTKRKTIKVWFVVFCCATTATINIKVMEDYSTNSFVLSFIRFACEAGYPKTLLVDEGSQLIKGCETMKLTYVDTKNRLHHEMSVDFQVCPVGGHNFNGKVERRIRHIKESLEKTVQNERLSITQWETVASQIANAINDLPLALGNIIADFENMDLLTPNRLRLGRNNERSPIFPMVTTDNHLKVINNNNKIFESWFEAWLISHVPKLMERPKWFNTDRDMKICDVVLLLKQEGAIGCTYQYGMINEIQRDGDEVIRRVKVKYRNHNENFDRFTWRSVRQLIIIHPVDELTIMEELDKLCSHYIL